MSKAADDNALPVSKRSKFSFALKKGPPIVGRHIFASNSAKKMRTQRVAIIEPMDAGYDSFFDGVDASGQSLDGRFLEGRSEDYKILAETLKAIRSKNAAEDTLRDCVYTGLLHLGIDFPRSARTASEPGVALRNKVEKYSESALVSLFAEFKEKQWPDAHSVTQMEKMMEGLPFTTTSKPDAAVIVNGRAAAHGSASQLVFGEFKNGSSYSTADSVYQCSLYLYALLFWLRAKCGLKVNVVYGFTFCGRRCNDQEEGEEYSVWLVKVSTPEALNGRLKVERLVVRGNVNDPTPFRILIHFLKHGKRWEFDRNDTVPLHPLERRIPVFFTLPSTLWTDTNDRKLVLNGTMAIVFRVNKSGLEDLLANQFTPFSNKRLGDDMESMVETLGSDKYYYIKIRSTDTCMENNPLAAMQRAVPLIKKDQDLRLTYCLPFYDDDLCGVIIMNDRGKSLAHLEQGVFETLSALCTAFNMIIGTVLHLCPELTHGDVLPHNFCFDGIHLHLIDIDEGVGKNSSVCERELVYSGNEDWLTAMTYPNVLSKDSLRYTKMQLVASFLMLALLGHEEHRAVLELRQQAEDVGKWLQKKGSSKYEIARDSKHGEAIDSVFASMKSLVENEATDG